MDEHKYYTDADLAYLARNWQMIADPLGRIHFVDACGEWEYMGGVL